MVDPNPARGMPIALQRYWLTGKGAAKIRWGSPGDFKRCVRALATKFPENPEGLCNILHQKALGKPPGEHSYGHALDTAKELAEAEALLAAAPMLGNRIWMAPLAPIGVRTGDGRMFTEGSLSFRALPLPLEWAKARNGGHAGAITIGRILGTTIGPDELGQEYAWGWGDLLPEELFPEVKQAVALMEGGVAGLSLDPGGFVEVLAGAGREANFTSYRAGGATLVSIPAFEGQKIWLGGPEDVLGDDGAVIPVELEAGREEIPELSVDECDCLVPDGEVVTLAVNATGWRGLPIAGRDESVDRDDAIKRIAIWANGDTAKLNRAFLWRHPTGNPQSVYSYRLPVGDIIDGKLMLIYHAIYAASALIEGAHGGLPNIPDEEKDDLRRVISKVYKHMAEHFNDPTIEASWDRETKRNNGVTGKEDSEGDKGDFSMPLTELASEVLDAELAVRSGGWSSLPIASTGRSWDEGAARAALDSWAGDSIDKYARGFLWRGGDNKTDMKFPIAMPIDGDLTIVPRAVSAALGRLNQASIPAGDKSRMRGILESIQKRYQSDEMAGGWYAPTDVIYTQDASLLELNANPPHPELSDALVASMAPVAPPASWFAHQDIQPSAAGLEITPEGQVRGYLALWKTCHRSVGKGTCVKPPRNTTGYQHFRLGSVLTAEGELIKVGRISVGGGHADPWLGVIPALEHYDNASTATAIVVPHQDKHGIQLAGGLIPGVTPEQIAALRRHQVSGDWRFHDKRMELVAVLAVNTPGYPVFAQDGDNMTLLAAMTFEDTEDHEHEEFEMSEPEETVEPVIVPVEARIEFSGEDVDDLAEKVAAKAMDHLERMRQENEHAKALASHKAFADEQTQAQRAAKLAEVTSL